MRTTKTLLMTSVLALTVAACGGDKSVETKTPKSTGEVTVPATGEYNLKAELAKIAPITLTPDTSFLTDKERQVVNLLIEAAGYMDEIYIRQLDPNNPATREAISRMKRADRDEILDMFDLHYGVCDTLNEGRVFWGDTACPDGAGFYPRDMTKAEFEQWIVDNPGDKAAFTSGYTVIERTDDGGLKAVPYHVKYAEFLKPAADLMKEAASITENANLKTFLNLRAASFLNDEYFDSEMAWMDLDGPVEVAIGPYEVYDDKMFGYKTAYEAFITIKNPEESAALDKYKDYLRDMEKNLPVEEAYKNFDRGFESPIAVTYQVHGGGDNVPGVQTIAFNLPNDERVREAKGAKKVLLNNVIGAKYDLILKPLAARVLVPGQASKTQQKYMSYSTLFHELSHSLGPGVITKDGAETEVRLELKDLYSGIEEGKADVMGAYNVLYMMERGELPASEKQEFLATYFAGLFRSMRFGIDAAHGKGAAFQYAYYREVDAVRWNEGKQRYVVNYEKLEQAISDLTGIVVVVQGDGDYAAAKAFLDKYVRLDAEAKIVLGNMDDIPVDVRPIYPDKI